MKASEKRGVLRPADLREMEGSKSRPSQTIRPVRWPTMPPRRSPGLLLSLQRSLGNQAVGRILLRPARAGHTLPGVTSQRQAERGAIQRRNGRRRRRANTGTVTIRNVQHQTYAVSGQTLADVHSQLDPTEWGRCSYNYSYTYSSSGGNATRVNITLRLTIRLPRWTGRGWNSASRAVKAEWRRMLRALRAHENRHAAIARRWAPTFKQRMLNQPEDDLEDTFNQVLGEVDTEQGQFDTRTSHGQTQGVSLDTSIQ